MSIRKYERVTKKKVIPPSSPLRKKRPLSNARQVQHILMQATKKYDVFKNWIHFSKGSPEKKQEVDEVSSIVDQVTHFTGDFES